MTYRICYFRGGKEQGSTPWPGALDMMKKIAADGLVRHGMDRAVITDEDGAIVWSSAGHASGTLHGVPPVLGDVVRKVGRRAAR